MCCFRGYGGGKGGGGKKKRERGEKKGKVRESRTLEGAPLGLVGEGPSGWGPLVPIGTTSSILP